MSVSTSPEANAELAEHPVHDFLSDLSELCGCFS